MTFMDFFTRTPVISPDAAKLLFHEKGLGQYNLIDVRQPKEYAEHHLAGAELIPLGELSQRLSEIDPSKPTIVY